MTAIEVSFLTGRYTATAHHDRSAHEWPPHAARLFSAMVAAWADADPPGETERTALEWLETQPPPRINAPGAVARRAVSHFVPVNDTRVIAGASYDKRVEDVADLLGQFEDEVESSGGELTAKARRLQNKIDKKLDVESMVGRAGTTNFATAVALLPEHRGKKERHFPSVTLLPSEGAESTVVLPPVSSVTYAWDDSPTPDVTKALDSLLSRVTRLGHSSSLISCRLIDEAPPATHTPGAGTQMLRWVKSGQLAALEAEHAQHKAIKPRSLPFQAVPYREVDATERVPDKVLIPTTAGDWIVFELDPSHRRMPVTRAVELARVLREAVLSHVEDPIPEGVSGHVADGRPTEVPHLSYLALPNVNHERADGRIMGLAVSLPHDLDEAARRATLRGIGTWEDQREDRRLQLTMGPNGDAWMQRRQPPFSLTSLNPRVWERRSRWWASATPVALPTHPGNLVGGTPAARAKAWARAEESVAKSCEHVGLPRPVDVRVSFVSDLVGTRPARDFPAFKQGRKGGGVQRRLVHVSVEFTEEVRGPLVLGSGRFVGLGLMRPMDEPAEREESNEEGVGDG